MEADICDFLPDLNVAVKFEVNDACGSGGLANSLGGANCVLSHVLGIC